MQEFDFTACSGSTLAYLGDAVMELYVRDKLVKSGLCHPGELNKHAHEYVRASRQAGAFHRIENLLTEEETDIFRRGRNAGPTNNLPKNSTASEYRCATGFEALLGWLYLKGYQSRISQLLEQAYTDY